MARQSRKWIVLGISLWLFGCNSAAPASTSGTAAPGAEPLSIRAEPLSHIEIVTAGGAPDAPLPTVIAVHGLGDRPENFQHIFAGLTVPVRVLLPRAPTPHLGGFSWFDIRLPMIADDPHLAAGIDRAVKHIAAFIKEAVKRFPASGRPLLTGFSQGGAVSFAVAARHPDLIAAAVPLSGALPTDLLPRSTAMSYPLKVRAAHGAVDPLIPAAAAEQTVNAFHDAGMDVSLHIFDRLGHSVDGRMRDFLFAEIRAFADSTASLPGPGLLLHSGK